MHTSGNTYMPCQSRDEETSEFAAPVSTRGGSRACARAPRAGVLVSAHQARSRSRKNASTFERLDGRARSRARACACVHTTGALRARARARARASARARAPVRARARVTAPPAAGRRERTGPPGRAARRRMGSAPNRKIKKPQSREKRPPQNNVGIHRKGSIHINSKSVLLFATHSD
eukprot:6183634-Pleurochrysis_carterae.AAC.2